MKFLNKTDIIHIYGLTQDPITKEYIFVMKYIEDGSLQNYLTKNFKNLKWKDKIYILQQIIKGLKDIHEKEIIHHDLHSGNILSEKDMYSIITDLGLSCPASQTSASNRNDIFGVLPYVAPEVLREKPYTKASDIYSFGVLMSVVSTGQQPFNNLAHDEYLAMKICEGVRPGFSNNTPKFYIELAFRCMDANPDKRPTAKEIKKIIDTWKIQQDESIRKEFDEMDEIKFDPSTITDVIHPNAVYISRLLKFRSLPQPVNSNKVTIIGNNNGNY
jgi:serine/threonine protein kinase